MIEIGLQAKHGALLWIASKCGFKQWSPRLCWRKEFCECFTWRYGFLSVSRWWTIREKQDCWSLSPQMDNPWSETNAIMNTDCTADNLSRWPTCVFRTGIQILMCSNRCSNPFHLHTSLDIFYTLATAQQRLSAQRVREEAVWFWCPCLPHVPQHRLLHHAMNSRDALH